MYEENTLQNIMYQLVLFVFKELVPMNTFIRQFSFLEDSMQIFSSNCDKCSSEEAALNVCDGEEIQ